MKRNPHLNALSGHYLFPEIARRTQHFLKDYPKAKLISLGIGDTTQPIPASITHALVEASARLGTETGYCGYGPEQGIALLREKIASTLYNDLIRPEEIFISDGAKCDLGRLQTLFGSNLSIAVQDPTYPVYLEGSLLQGICNIIPMPSLPENHFFPNLKGLLRSDLIYFCSPNNPTGVAATHDQLKALVQFAQNNGSIIIFDAAYAHYIQDPSRPKSIYEIEGAKCVAIEINSFSKLAGFTGIRLGWSVIPEELKYDDGASIRADWHRLISTIFNGASMIAQAGGCAVLEQNGLKEVNALMQFYLQNSRSIKEALIELGYEVFGGNDAPYLWVHFKEKKSWEMFDYFLKRYHLITIPGSGFGPSGEGFVRLTAFGQRASILEAIERLKT